MANFWESAPVVQQNAPPQDANPNFWESAPVLNQQPLSMGGRAMDVVAQTGKGLATAFPYLASAPAQAGQWLGNKAISGIEYMRGVDPQETQGRIDRLNAAEAQNPFNPANLGSNVASMTGIGEPKTFAGGVANTAANILPTLLTGSGELNLLQKGLSALGAGVGNETVKEAIPEGNPIKPYAELTAAVLGGGLAHGIGSKLQPSAVSTIAKSVQTNPKALSALAQSIGDIQTARTTAQSLGPEAMVANLTPQATQNARALASMSLPNSSKIQTTAQSIIDNSGNRASQDWQNVIGPMKSKFDKNIELTTQKLGASNLYELAKGRTIDATPVYEILPKVAEDVKFNKQASTSVNEIQKMVSDQYKGNDIVHSANDLIGVRQRIDELISNAGGMPHPGLDLYELGKKTSTGRALLQIRKSINDTLHQDPTLKEADNIFSGASNSQTAFELGNTRIIGRGDSVMEPQAAAARWSKMSAQEKSSVLEGLGRKGQNAIRDVSHNRNDGKAMADSFTTENNLSRLDALGLDSSKVRNMAAREDTLASSNNRIIGGSDTARTDLARQNFPEVGKPVGSSLDSVVNVGTFGMSAVAKKGLQKIVDAYRFKKNNAAADLYSRQGGAANSLLDAIDKLNLSKKSKAQIFSRIAQQSAISGGAAQLNNSERR